MGITTTWGAENSTGGGGGGQKRHSKLSDGLIKLKIKILQGKQFY